MKNIVLAIRLAAEHEVKMLNNGAGGMMIDVVLKCRRYC